jgi:hypothetical protein
LPSTAFTADSIQTTDYLLNVAPTTGEATDTFILQINQNNTVPNPNTPGFSLNGSPVPVTGLSSSFGLYLEGSLTLHANGPISVYDSGTIALVADRFNDNGTPSATFDPVTGTGGVNFSNPTGLSNDITLATGSLLSGSFGPQSNGRMGLNLVMTFLPSPGEEGFFVSPVITAHTMLNATLFNTSSSRVPGSWSGGTYVTVNEGYGVADFTVPEPATIGLLGTGLLGLLALRRGRRRPDASS